MNECLVCGTETQNKVCSRSCQGKYARSKRITPSRHNSYHKEEFKQKQSLNGKSSIPIKYGNIINELRFCLNCKTPFIVQYRTKTKKSTKQFCSQSCTGKWYASHNSQLMKKRAADDPDYGWKNPAARKKAHTANSRWNMSKPEQEIIGYLNEYDEWVSQHMMKSKHVDAYNPKQNKVFEFDGPSHFRVIWDKNKFEQQQNRDRLIAEECNNASMILIRMSYDYWEKILQKDSKKAADLVKQTKTSMNFFTGKE